MYIQPNLNRDCARLPRRGFVLRYQWEGYRVVVYLRPTGRVVGTRDSILRFARLRSTVMASSLPRISPRKYTADDVTYTIYSILSFSISYPINGAATYFPYTYIYITNHTTTSASIAGVFEHKDLRLCYCYYTYTLEPYNTHKYRIENLILHPRGTRLVVK